MFLGFLPGSGKDGEAASHPRQPGQLGWGGSKGWHGLHMGTLPARACHPGVACLARTGPCDVLGCVYALTRGVLPLRKKSSLAGGASPPFPNASCVSPGAGLWSVISGLRVVPEQATALIRCGVSEEPSHVIERRNAPIQYLSQGAREPSKCSHAGRVRLGGKTRLHPGWGLGNEHF